MLFKFYLIFSEPDKLENITILGKEGNLTSPGYPKNYQDNISVTYTLKGPPNTRIIVSFLKIDIESQKQCKYDYVGVASRLEDPMERHCGHHTVDMRRYKSI